ncbi:MAG: hypothetical protein ACJ8EP_03685, partial [Sphingomicrobium sp.]
MQNLVGIGAHTGALARGEDDNGKAALIAHGEEQWHADHDGASILSQQKGRLDYAEPPEGAPL